MPVEKPGSEFEIEAILAIGFVGPGPSKLIDEIGIQLDARGNVKADHNQMTRVKGGFVAGDTTTGQALVVRAIADGRKTAGKIQSYLE